MNSRSDERQSIILLGASNLTLGWKHVLKALQTTVPGPLDLRVSLGLGRSYVDWSGFMLRRLPGIIDCGLWDSLQSTSGSTARVPATDDVQSRGLQSSDRPPLVLVTDLGNDIVYMHSPEKIFEAASRCIRRIQQWRPDARIVMTGLPLASLDSVGPVRFVIVRSILFPGCLMPLQEIYDKSRVLNKLVQDFAAQNNFPFVEPQAEWYRADPIHVIPPLREQVFRQFFSHWQMSPPSIAEVASLPVARLPTSAIRTVAGFRRQASQPVFHSSELTISAW
jgi:hypothetical protein